MSLHDFVAWYIVAMCELIWKSLIVLAEMGINVDSRRTTIKTPDDFSTTTASRHSYFYKLKSCLGIAVAVCMLTIISWLFAFCGLIFYIYFASSITNAQKNFQSHSLKVICGSYIDAGFSFAQQYTRIWWFFVCRAREPGYYLRHSN